LLELGRYREALDAYRKTLSLDPDMPKVKVALAQLRDRIDMEKHQRWGARPRPMNDDPEPHELEGLDELEEE